MGQVDPSLFIANSYQRAPEKMDLQPGQWTNLVPSALVHAFPLTTPLKCCFNWQEVMSEKGFDESTRFYVVVFRSKRREGADAKLLYAADAEAQEEARNSGGLLMYWFGNLNERRECFATCIWKSREDAEKANKLPKHLNAIKLAAQMYDSYKLEKYWLTSAIDNEPIFDRISEQSKHP